MSSKSLPHSLAPPSVPLYPVVALPKRLAASLHPSLPRAQHEHCTSSSPPNSTLLGTCSEAGRLAHFHHASPLRNSNSSGVHDTRTHTHICVCVCVCVHVCACECVCMHTHTNTLSHAPFIPSLTYLAGANSAEGSRLPHAQQVPH